MKDFIPHVEFGEFTRREANHLYNWLPPEKRIPTLSPDYLYAAVLAENSMAADENPIMGYGVGHDGLWQPVILGIGGSHEFWMHGILFNYHEKKFKHPYPYGGVLTNSSNYKFRSGCQQLMDEWLRDNGITSGFLRTHPMINEFSVRRKNRDVVVIDLTLPQMFSDTALQKIDKARNAGLTVQRCEDMEGFRNFYREGMDKLGARDFYYFNDAYFDALEELRYAHMFKVVDKYGKMYCASIILLGPDIAEYHLTATSNDGRRAGATNLLVAQAAEWAGAQNCSWFYLGGGKTEAPDDPLLMFKKSFSHVTKPFFTDDWQ